MTEPPRRKRYLAPDRGAMILVFLGGAVVG